MRNTEPVSIEDFYALLKKGTTICEFLERSAEVSAFIRSNNHFKEYRLAKSRLKRLRDEIAPTEVFMRRLASPADKIQFPLDSGDTDCNWSPVYGRPLIIQVTVAQARERLNCMIELNDTGEGRGFLGLTDDRPTADFLAEIKQERRMYSTSEAQRTMVRAIGLVVRNKARSRGDILLIDAPLHYLPEARWLEVKPDLAELTRNLSFSEVYLVSDLDAGFLRLK